MRLAAYILIRSLQSFCNGNFRYNGSLSHKGVQYILYTCVVYKMGRRNTRIIIQVYRSQNPNHAHLYIYIYDRGFTMRGFGKKNNFLQIYILHFIDSRILFPHGVDNIKVRRCGYYHVYIFRYTGVNPLLAITAKYIYTPLYIGMG